MTLPALRNALFDWFVEAADLSAAQVVWEIQEEPPAEPPLGTMRIVSVGPLDPAPADYEGRAWDAPLRVTGVGPGPGRPLRHRPAAGSVSVFFATTVPERLVLALLLDADDALDRMVDVRRSLFSELAGERFTRKQTLRLAVVDATAGDEIGLTINTVPAFVTAEEGESADDLVDALAGRIEDALAEYRIQADRDAQTGELVVSGRPGIAFVHVIPDGPPRLTVEDEVPALAATLIETGPVRDATDLSAIPRRPRARLDIHFRISEVVPDDVPRIDTVTARVTVDARETELTVPHQEE
jgi:hypothetical protein